MKKYEGTPKKLTMIGFLEDAEKAKLNHAINFLVIEVQVEGTTAPEIIINPDVNFNEKINYYKKAYDEKLTGKNGYFFEWV